MEYQYEQWNGEVIVCTISHENFRDFIHTPDKEKLTTQYELLGNCVYSKTYDGLRISRKYIRDDLEVIEVYENFYMQPVNLPIHIQFVEFFTDGGIKAFIRENGVNNEIEDCYILMAQGVTPIPLTIWVKASDDYFITINETFDDYSFDPPHYIYRLYTQDQFIEKFGLKDGTLFVNGEDITGTNYVKFENNFVYLPFRAILEKLGCTVEWEGENRRAIFYNKAIKYVLRLKEYPMVVEINDSLRNDPIPPGGVGNVFCKIITGSIVLDVQSMRSIVKLLGATIDVNYNELIVNIY